MPHFAIFTLLPPPFSMRDAFSALPLCAAADFDAAAVCRRRPRQMPPPPPLLHDTIFTMPPPMPMPPIA
jgi:hypothetical protein